MQRLIGIGIATLALSGVALCADEKARPETKSDAVNPALCKTGNKSYVYWAAKDQVFRFKYDPALPIRPFPEKELTAGMHFDARQEVPAAPNPSEPLGCYGNPLRALEIPYMDAFDAELFRKLVGRKLEFGVGMRGFFALPTNFLESSTAERVFPKSKTCWKRPSGIQECSLAIPTGKERIDYLIAHPLKIGKELLPRHPQVGDVYVTVQTSNRPLAPNGQRWLTASSQILLFGNVNLESSFDIFPQEIDFLIPYYSGLIRYVLDAHVPDYRWNATKTK